MKPTRLPEKRSYHEVAPPSDYYKANDSDLDGIISWSPKQSRYTDQHEKIVDQLDSTYQGTVN